MTDFKGGTGEFLARFKATGRPVALTINGKAETVMQDAAAYGDLLESTAGGNCVKRRLELRRRGTAATGPVQLRATDIERSQRQPI